jgi:F0F1-type ATP synthase assembly protein I
MVASTPTNPHSLATASGLLLGTLGIAMAVGAVIGWLLGGAGLGLLIGAVLGIPLAVFVVYRVYSRVP